MNDFQLNKLKQISNNPNQNEEVRTLIRVLLAERLELLQALNRIKYEAADYAVRGDMWRI